MAVISEIAGGKEEEAQPLGGRVLGMGRGEKCWAEPQVPSDALVH